MTNKILTKEDLRICIYTLELINKIKYKDTIDKLKRMHDAVEEDNREKLSYEKEDWDKKDECCC